MTHTNNNIIPMPCPTQWQEEQRKARLSPRALLCALESLVTLAIGVCALLSTTVYLVLCI